MFLSTLPLDISISLYTVLVCGSYFTLWYLRSISSGVDVNANTKSNPFCSVVVVIGFVIRRSTVFDNVSNIIYLYCLGCERIST